MYQVQNDGVLHFYFLDISLLMVITLMARGILELVAF